MMLQGLVIIAAEAKLVPGHLPALALLEELPDLQSLRCDADPAIGTKEFQAIPRRGLWLAVIWMPPAA